ncbi:hypothetical protein [Pseudonocardia sp. NPDC049635]
MNDVRTVPDGLSGPSPAGSVGAPGTGRPRHRHPYALARTPGWHR